MNNDNFKLKFTKLLFSAETQFFDFNTQYNALQHYEICEHGFGAYTFQLYKNQCDLAFVLNNLINFK